MINIDKKRLGSTYAVIVKIYPEGPSIMPNPWCSWWWWWVFKDSVTIRTLYVGYAIVVSSVFLGTEFRIWAKELSYKLTYVWPHSVQCGDEFHLWQSSLTDICESVYLLTYQSIRDSLLNTRFGMSAVFPHLTSRSAPHISLYRTSILV